jgi:putative SOS response-associated peptidase YedK
MPAFRDALKSRSCLIPADDFYEGMRTEETKKLYCFEVGEGGLFGFAGIWDRRKDPSRNWMKPFSILIKTPNAVTSSVPVRMPVNLNQTSIQGALSFDAWLDPGMKYEGSSPQLLKLFDAGQTRCFPVSTGVNHAANDNEECSAPGILPKCKRS